MINSNSNSIWKHKQEKKIILHNTKFFIKKERNKKASSFLYFSILNLKLKEDGMNEMEENKLN